MDLTRDGRKQSELVLPRVERRTMTIGGTRWDITITHRHNPVAHRDAQEMFIGMIVQQLMDDMLQRVDAETV